MEHRVRSQETGVKNSNFEIKDWLLKYLRFERVRRRRTIEPARLA